MTCIVAKIATLGLLIVVTYSMFWLIPPKPYLVYSSLLYPAIAESFWPFEKNRQVIETLNSTILQQNVIQPLTTPADAVWPDTMFFDTVYHLTRQGRQLRSELLAERLAALLGSNAAAK